MKNQGDDSLQLVTDAQKQAYAELIRIIENCQNTAKINGKTLNKEEADRYFKIAHLCVSLFKNKQTDAKKIEIEEPTKEKPFVGVTVYMDAFELSTKNKNEFNELIQLADEIIFYGDEENYFHMTFYVNDIWAE